MKRDTILSVEFRTLIKRNNEKIDTIYHSVVLNPIKKDDNELIAFELKNIIPNFKYELIYSYVESYEKMNNVGINLLAYKTGSNYVITWGITEKNLNIYAGGEGEWFGNYKIQIPLSELKAKTTANKEVYKND